MTEAAGLDGIAPDGAGAAAAGAASAQAVHVQQPTGEAAAAEAATARFGKARRVAMYVAYVGDGYSVRFIMLALRGPHGSRHCELPACSPRTSACQRSQLPEEWVCRAGHAAQPRRADR